MSSPVVRLVGRALLAGVATFVSVLQTTSGHMGRDVLIGAITAGAWAAVEYITPLNGVVGPNKPNPPAPPTTKAP
jgi:hypothetical protein